jgi:hypothetical protein
VQVDMPVLQLPGRLPGLQRLLPGSQQPVGEHVAGLHTHELPVQTLPLGHAAPSTLHTQLPRLSQVSVWVVLHVWQLPPLPHWGQSWPTHELPEQQVPVPQPPGQPAQTPELHKLPWQLMHGPPSLPHAVPEVPPRHWLGATELSQQPAQVAGSQTHWPS